MSEDSLPLDPMDRSLTHSLGDPNKWECAKECKCVLGQFITPFYTLPYSFSVSGPSKGAPFYSILRLSVHHTLHLYCTPCGNRTFSVL
jgi:hypothetical protein